ncbi:hypothetical protein CMQ_2461 [Grosmannia clavigera kw1407]|uniref:Uncharacterized protein n=1 Tax=Grosmannia clavigera (strain kw1407 / UAMH 11150) TaxID=655863 RepID=F0XJI6_GROCL|nr:uncharacterized protein CMQ_2461 [Grosmannia clavigera kw1407]EFX02412.1 hypothetical protein CMQ_2461 [Grosmannia clavigera kw1407]
MFVEGVDVLVIVVAMDELHVREMERRRAKDEAAGTADAKTRVTEPSPEISQITSIANGMEVVLQRREQAVLKENGFIGEMRMRIMALHTYVDQHRLSRLTLPAGRGSQHA